MSNSDEKSTSHQMELKFDTSELSSLQNEIKRVASRAISESSKSRWHIAAEISEMMGMEVTKSMLDCWTAESKEGHRFPLFVLPAFCITTENYDLIRLICKACQGLFLGKDTAILAEIARMDKQIKKLQEKREQLLKLSNMLDKKDGEE